MNLNTLLVNGEYAPLFRDRHEQARPDWFTHALSYSGEMKHKSAMYFWIAHVRHSDQRKNKMAIKAEEGQDSRTRRAGAQVGAPSRSQTPDQSTDTHSRSSSVSSTTAKLSTTSILEPKLPYEKMSLLLSIVTEEGDSNLKLDRNKVYNLSKPINYEEVTNFIRSRLITADRGLYTVVAHPISGRRIIRRVESQEQLETKLLQLHDISPGGDTI